MSALLKAGDGSAQSAVCPFGTSDSGDHASPLTLPQMAGALVADTPQHDHRLELEATIAELRSRLADAINDADEREDAAFERGRREGEGLATGEADKRLELLATGLEALQLAHTGRVDEYELLALQLARAALARIFDDEALSANLVSETITKRLSMVKRELVLGLRVSARDFRSPDELAELAARFASVEILQDEALEAGGCVVDLRLGTINLGLRGQWQRLSAFFDGLAEAESIA